MALEGESDELAARLGVMKMDGQEHEHELIAMPVKALTLCIQEVLLC